MSTRVRPVGSRALIVDLPDTPTVMDWHAALAAEPLAGQVDAVAAARTVLVTFDSPSSARAGAARLEDFRPGRSRGGQPREITIDVRYDGADLVELADTLGMSTSELVEWHTSTTWVAAFGGFAPGFAYCVPERDPGPDIPRRSSPRTSVPAGAVALAGGFSAVYPRTSPGGWQLVGTTRAQMWDPDAERPALIAPGDRVRYRGVDTLAEPGPAARQQRAQAARRPIFTVDDAGLLTVYQDLGRPGRGDLGVTGSGFADRASALAANAAVGNPRGAAVLENVGGLALTARAEAVVCVTGALSDVTVGGRPMPLARPVMVGSGETLSVAPPRVGARSYVAVRGGFVAETELDSASTDILSGLGPAPVVPGSTLSVAIAPAGTVHDTLSNPLRVAGNSVTVRCVPGPRDDWFTAEAIEALYSTGFTVTPESNRVGLRLASPAPLKRRDRGELASEGMVAGSIQVPPNGQPVLFLRDHAVTGGYPVIATVVAEDVDIAAQLPPGATIRFEPLSDQGLSTHDA